MSQKCNSLAKN